MRCRCSSRSLASFPHFFLRVLLLLLLLHHLLLVLLPSVVPFPQRFPLSHPFTTPFPPSPPPTNFYARLIQTSRCHSVRAEIGTERDGDDTAPSGHGARYTTEIGSYHSTVDVYFVCIVHVLFQIKCLFSRVFRVYLRVVIRRAIFSCWIPRSFRHRAATSLSLPLS